MLAEEFPEMRRWTSRSTWVAATTTLTTTPCGLSGRLRPAPRDGAAAGDEGLPRPAGEGPQGAAARSQSAGPLGALSLSGRDPPRRVPSGDDARPRHPRVDRAHEVVRARGRCGRLAGPAAPKRD